MSQMSRRELVGAAGVVAAAGLFPAAAAGAAGRSGDGSPTLPESDESNRFDFAKIEPQVVREGGTVTECTGKNFPVDTFSVQELVPGQIGFIPQGYAHYIENVGSDEMRWVVVFNNTYPDDIGLSTTFAGMPTHTFTDTFGLPKGALAKADKPDHTLFIVEPT
jgi:oxalate decarboxylase/phosphoglucose isomerase-like protein (cupin superfamily)